MSILFILLNIFDTLGNYFGQFAEEVIGSPLLIGVLIFLFIFFFCSILFIPIEAMVVIFIPTTFIIALWLPVLQLIIAILISIVIGLGLLKWIRG